MIPRQAIREPYCDTSYILALDDGLAWCLVGNSETSAWLHQLASIMTLRPGKSDGLRKISIVQCAEGIGHCQIPNPHPLLPKASALPHSGWRMHDLLALRVWSHPDVADMICELLDIGHHDLAILAMQQAVFPFYQAGIGQGGTPLHAALVEYDGKGILIAASGGRGKSTCCRRVPKSWTVLCDDETLVVRSPSGTYHAHPFPTWSDYLFRRTKKTWNVQRSTQLSAIFFLDQGESDDVARIGQARAAARINQSAGQVCGRMWRRLPNDVQRDNNLKLFSNSCGLAKAVPAFTLHASLTGRFWEGIEKVLAR
ncbi:MAG: SynChlorMet cassette protein ScmC [Desulfomonilaceae bacterium]